MRAVNLLPRQTKLRRKRLSVAGQLALLAPFVVGGLITAGYLLTTSKVNDRKASLEVLREELASLPPPPPQPVVNEQLALQRDQRIAALSSALQTRLAWDRVLREISAVLPGDVWLTTLSAQGATPQPAPTTTPPSTTPAPGPTVAPLTLAGYTYSQEGVARLLTRLAVVPALQDVALVSSARSNIAGRFVYSFSITANVRGGEIG